MNTKKRNWSTFYLVGILIATGLIYSASLKGDFLSYDDTENITGNMLIRDLSPGSLPAFFKSTSLYMYSPVTFLSYALDYKLAGMDAFYFRLTNLLLHLMNVLLVFLLGMKLFKRSGLSLIMAALFALSPVNADTVAWISARSNLLATLFFLLSLLLYLDYLKNKNYLFYGLSIVAFLLSLFSKSAVVMLPFTLFLLDYLFARKLNIRLVLEKIPFFAIALLFGLIAIWFRTDTGATQTTILYTLPDRFFMICYSLMNYLVISIVPVNLSEVYGYPQKSGGALPLWYYLAPFLILGIVILILRTKSIRREMIFGLLFFLLNIIITQIVMLEDSFRSNRYAYMPFLGLFFIYIIAGDTALKHNPAIRKYAVIPFLILAVLYGIMTFQRSLVWKDSLGLFNHAIMESPDAAFVYNSRGIAKYSQGDMKGALNDYDQAITLNPQYSGAYYNRGIVYYNIGQYTNAMNDYSKGITLNPNFASSYVARGILYMDVLKNYPAAMNDYTKAIEINSLSAQAFYNRGILMLRMNNPDNACLDFKKVKQLGYDRADDLINRFCR